MSLRENDVVGKQRRFVALKKIGFGASSEVWLGRETQTQQLVAIKVAQADAGANLSALFSHEAEVLARLSGTASGLLVHEAGADFLVLEYVDGVTLRHKLARGETVAPEQAFNLTRQLCSALHTLHAGNIVHRDVKPENILVAATVDGWRVVLIDFGVALMDGTHPTHVERPIGTRVYMAPEQQRGELVGPAADVFAAGVVLAELLTGCEPDKARARLFHSGCTVDQATFINRMLASNVAERPTAGQTATRLKSWEADCARRRTARSSTFSYSRPPSRRRAATALTLAAIVLAIAAAVARLWLARNGSPRSSEQHCSQASGVDRVCVPETELTMGNDEPAIHDQCRLIGAECTEDVLAKLRRQLPAHRVRVSTFAMDRTEVTCAQFADHLNRHLLDTRLVDENEGKLVRNSRTLVPDKRYVYRRGVRTYDIGATKSCIRWDRQRQRFVLVPGTERHPIDMVTQPAAQFYCQEHDETLPTEAQQEAAMRGSDDRLYPSGMRLPTCSEVAFDQEDDSDGRHPRCAALPATSLGMREVGTSPVDETPLGIRDLDGNVSEWSRDGWSDRYRPCPSTCVDPLTKPDPDGWVAFRGGNYLAASVMMLSTFRGHAHALEIREGLGFRCVKNFSREQAQ